MVDLRDTEGVDFVDTDGFGVDANGVDAADELEDGVIGCKRCLGDGLCDLHKSSVIMYTNAHVKHLCSTGY